jgi:hypothetical protein
VSRGPWNIACHDFLVGTEIMKRHPETNAELKKNFLAAALVLGMLMVAAGIYIFATGIFMVM